MGAVRGWRSRSRSSSARRSTRSRTRTCTPGGRRSKEASGLLQGDPLEDVRHVLELVDGRLHLVDDVLRLEDVHRPLVAAEQVRYGLAIDPIALVLQAVDLDRMRPQLPVLG